MKSKAECARLLALTQGPEWGLLPPSDRAQIEWELIHECGCRPVELPVVAAPRSAVVDGRIRVDLLLTALGFARSHREARRLVAQGAVSVQQQRLPSGTETVPFVSGMVVQVGRRQWAEVVLAGSPEAKEG